MLLLKNRLSIFVLLLCATITVHAQGINIEHVSCNLVNETYWLDAKIGFEFDEEVIEALKHGIALTVDVSIKIKRQRNWIWDVTVKEDILVLKLEYHPLSKHYLVTDLSSGYRYQLLSEEDAMEVLGTISNHMLIELNELNIEKNYYGFMKAELNIETLPLPMRPAAHVSKQWRLKSEWYKWEIKK